MPSNKQAQPLKPLIKTWTGWERGIGYLPESDEDETKGLYFANGVLGIHGELRPAPFFRSSSLLTNMIRRTWPQGNNRQGAALILPISGVPKTDGTSGIAPTVASTAFKQGTAANNNALFEVGTITKPASTDGAVAVNHEGGFDPKGVIFWSTGQTSDGAANTAGGSNFIGFADGTSSRDRSIAWNSLDNANSAPTKIAETNLLKGIKTGSLATVSQTVAATTNQKSSVGHKTHDITGVSITTDRLVLVTVQSQSLTEADAPVLSGLNQTWVVVNDYAANIATRITIFRCQPSSNQSGTITSTWDNNQIDSVISVNEFNNVILGDNGGNAIIQSAQDSDSPAVKIHTNSNLSAMTTGNATYGIAIGGYIPGVTSIAPEAGWTELNDLTNGTYRFEDMFKNSADATPTWTCTQPTFDIALWFSVVVEIGAGISDTQTLITDSFDASEDRLVLLVVDAALSGGTAEVPTGITSTGLTWAQVSVSGTPAEKSYNSGERMLSVWRALNSSSDPASSAATVTFSTAHTGIKYSISEFENVVLTGSNGDEATDGQVPQTASATAATTIAITMGAADSDSAIFVATAVDIQNTITKDSNYTTIHQQSSSQTPVGAILTQWIDDNSDLTCTSTWGTTADGAQIGIELEFATALSDSTETARRYDNTCIQFVDKDGGTTPPEATLTSTSTSQFTLTWANNSGDANQYLIHYVMFGGTGVSAFVKEWTLATSVGNQSAITGVGFQSDFLFNISSFLTAQGASGGSSMGFGMSDGTNENAIALESVDNAGVTTTSTSSSITGCLINKVSTDGTSTIDSFNGDGFVINNTTAWDAANLVASLCIKGFAGEIGQITRDTDSGDQTATGISIASTAYLLTSVLKTSNSDNSAHAVWAMGGASGLTETPHATAASCWTDENGQIVSDVYGISEDNTETTDETRDISWVELAVTDGDKNVVAGAEKMDIGEAGWITLDNTDSDDLSSAVLINYAGFPLAGDYTLSSASVTTSANANQHIIVGIASDKTSAITSVSFNTNEAFTKVASSSDTTSYALEFWILDNPSASTSAAITVNTSSAIDIIFGVWLIDGSDSTGIDGQFSGNDVDDYYGAGSPFNQPDVSSGTQIQATRDIFICISVDNSANSVLSDDGTPTGDMTATPTTLKDTALSAMTINAEVGKTVESEAGWLQVISNTADTFTGTAWTGAGEPADDKGWDLSGTSHGTHEVMTFDVYETNMHMVGTYIDDPWHQWQTHWYFEESIDDDDQYLYLSRGRPADANDTAPNISDPPVLINKISLRNADFGTDLGAWEFPNLTFPGQVARYKGNWHLPSSGTTNPQKLTVGSGTIEADTLSWSGDSDAGIDTVEHLANGAGTGGFQLVGMRAGKGWRETISEIAAGRDVDPTLEADWAAYFAAGDRNERAAGLSAVGGGDVFLNKDGLWSYYPDTGRSSLIFEDFKIWRSLFANIPVSPWRGGLIIPHPSGLLFWTPGQLPINIGFDAKTKSYADPPTNVTNYNQGRYLGVVGVGDYIYTLYQPDITSVEINVLCGYLHKGERKEEIVWQVIGTTFLYNPGYNANVGVSLLGRPKATTYETPTLWFNNGNDMNYVYLDDRAGPFRSTQRITTDGFAFLPELFFPERIDLSEMIIYTQGMRTGDSWQVSMFADNETEKNFGSPITKNGRNIIKIDRHNVYRTMFKLTWASSSTSETPTESPAIKRIELYGQPTTRGSSSDN